jgi:hypothetical protein
MYHISKPMELMEKISEVNDDILVVDTTLSMASGSFLKIVPQDPDSHMSAVDRSIAMRPTKRRARPGRALRLLGSDARAGLSQRER